MARRTKDRAGTKPAAWAATGKGAKNKTLVVHSYAEEPGRDLPAWENTYVERYHDDESVLQAEINLGKGLGVFAQLQGYTRAKKKNLKVDTQILED